jgi:hypothetical protein
MEKQGRKGDDDCLPSKVLFLEGISRTYDGRKGCHYYTGAK